MNNVLVTGSSGFLGAAAVTRLLDAGHNVIGLDPAPPAQLARRHVVDDLSEQHRLTELLRTEQVSHIIHCGGISGPMVMKDDPAQIMAINVGGSMNLLQASLSTGVKTFIYCSSVSAVGNFYESEPIGDDYPLQPASPYGCSKAAIDMVLRGLWRRVPMDLCSLRFTSIYGPGRRTSLTVDDIVTAAVRGTSVEVEPSTDWSYIYVDDAADAALAACFSIRRNQLCYYIAYPEQVTFAALATATGTSKISPPRLIVDNGKPSVARGALDIAPAQRDFDFTPKVSYHQGIRRMVDARIAEQA